jgi:hypothetical protein
MPARRQAVDDALGSGRAPVAHIAAYRGRGGLVERIERLLGLFRVGGVFPDDPPECLAELGFFILGDGLGRGRGGRLRCSGMRQKGCARQGQRQGQNLRPQTVHLFHPSLSLEQDRQSTLAANS